jgi:hypothetical protein
MSIHPSIMEYYQELNSSIFVRFATRLLYKKLLNKHDFHETRLSDSHTLLRAMNLYPYFTYSLVGLGAVQYTRSAETPLNTYDFHESWCSESHIFLKGINEILPIFSTLFI